MLGREMVNTFVPERGVDKRPLRVAALASGVLTAVSRRFSDQLGMTMAADLREQVIDKALRMDSATLERAGTGDVTSRVTEDVRAAFEAVVG